MLLITAVVVIGAVVAQTKRQTKTQATYLNKHLERLESLPMLLQSIFLGADEEKETSLCQDCTQTTQGAQSPPPQQTSDANAANTSFAETAARANAHSFVAYLQAIDDQVTDDNEALNEELRSIDFFLEHREPASSKHTLPIGLTYTNDLPKRLRQHNGELKGCAKATKGHAC